MPSGLAEVLLQLLERYFTNVYVGVPLLERMEVLFVRYFNIEKRLELVFRHTR